MTPLSRKFRVIAPYLIGFGPSDQPDLAYDADTFTDHLGGFLHASGAGDAILIGESLGGWVVARYAVRQGRKTVSGQNLPPISRLVICDGAVQVHPGEGGGAEASINNADIAKRAHEFYASLRAVDDRRTTEAARANVIGQQVSDEELKALKIPTLVLWGRQDRLLPLETGRHVASQIPGARLVIIDNCGHIPSVEQPRAFLGALGGFLGAELENL